MFKKKNENLQLHLLVMGFMEGYTCWSCHGEDAEVVVGQMLEQEARQEAAEDQALNYRNRAAKDRGNPISRFEGMQYMENYFAEMVHDVHEKVVDPDDEREAKKFMIFLEDSEIPLYPGCVPEHTLLAFNLDILYLHV